MSQVTNFYPIQNVFNAMIAFNRLVELGAKVNGKALPDLTFVSGVGTGAYELYVSKEHDIQGYRIKVNDVELTQRFERSIISAEEVMQQMIEEYEGTHKGKLPFVSMVRDGDATVTLYKDGSIRVMSERGVQLVGMIDRHPSMVTEALENILTSVM